MKERNLDWLKVLLPVIQTGFSVYMGKQFVKKTAENAKGIALKTGILAVGFISFFAFFVAAVTMIFVELGHQFERHEEIHFGGMVLGGLGLFTFGLIFLGICFGITKFLAARPCQKPAEEEAHPYAPIILFADEFLKQLIANLNKKET